MALWASVAAYECAAAPSMDPWVATKVALLYRECEIRRNMLIANAIQGELQCCQIWGGQRKREENHMSEPRGLWQLITGS